MKAASILRRLKSNKNFNSTGDEESPEAQVEPEKYTPIKCIFFTFLIAVFVVMSLLGRSLDTTNIYFSSTCVKNNLVEFTASIPGENIEFDSIVDYAHIWWHLDTILVPVLMNEQYDNGEPITNPLDKYRLGYQARVMGGIRIRQYRVKEHFCKYNNNKFKCYSDEEDKNDLKLKSFGKTVKWTSNDQNKESFYNTRAKHKAYPGSGFVIILPLNQRKSLRILQQLRNDSFIDYQTRFVSVDINLFNPTFATHTICRFLYEIGAEGSVTPSYQIQTWALSNHGKKGKAHAVFQLLFCVCVLLLTIKEFVDCYTCTRADGSVRGKLLRYMWTDVDFIFLVSYWVYIVFSLLLYIEEKNTDLFDMDNFQSLQYIQSLALITNYITAWCGLALFVNYFRFFKASPRLSFLFKMLHHSCFDIFSFCFVVAILLLGFSFAGFLLFGNEFMFRSMGHALANLSLHISSGIDFGDLEKTSPIMAPIYIAMWNIIIVIILANVFVAILCESYLVVQGKFKSPKNIFKSQWQKLKDSLNLTSKESDEEFETIADDEWIRLMEAVQKRKMKRSELIDCVMHHAISIEESTLPTSENETSPLSCETDDNMEIYNST